ncbi:hypothetical protein DQ240_15550 [Blastococcus sp. TF02A-26]|nr:hypothetical protein DQ240_15550 [Blastococcus sp. TF02A-26]
MTVAIGAAVVLATPGAAAAADPVAPLVSCVTAVQDGYWTAIFGYTNSTSVTQSQPVGGDNDFDPDLFNGAQVETFAPGTHHAVFTVRVPSAYSSIQWELYDSRVTAYRTGSTACPSSTQLPADGNGWGWAMGLGGSAVLGAGALVVEAWHRRRGTAGTAPPSMG